MNKRIRSLLPLENVVVVNFLTIGFSEVIGRAVTALATIYLARVLGVTSYGILGFVAAIILYFSAFIDWGIDLFGPREVAERPQDIGSLLSSLLVTRLAMAALLAVCLTVVGRLVLSKSESMVLGVYSLSLIAIALNSRWVHLGLEKTGIVALARTITEFTKVGLILVLIHGAGDVTRVPMVMFFSETLGALILIAGLRRNGVKLSFRLDLSIIKRMYSQSFPLMLTTLLALWIDNADLIYIRAFRSSHEVGIYLSAYTLINFMGILGNTIRMSLIPTLTRLKKNALDHLNLYHTAMARLFALGLPIAVGGYVLAPQIIVTLFGIDYLASASVLRILIWTVPFFLLRSVLASVLVARGMQNRVLQMTGVSMVFSLVMNLLLVPRIGMFATAITTVVTELLRLALGQHFVLSDGLTMTGIGRFWRTILAAIAMGGLLELIGPTSFWAALALGGLGYILALTLVGGLRFRQGELPVLNI